jgi:hypothetical protein
MNILINPLDFDIKNIFLSEIKDNTIINGVFIKVIYSSNLITLNGIFLLFPIIEPERRIYNGKQYLFFKQQDNMHIIDMFEKIERNIISLYYGNSSKTIVYTIHKQLKNGMIKFYQYSDIKLSLEPQYYMKISGIWETATEIGLTYKLIQY